MKFTTLLRYCQFSSLQCLCVTSDNVNFDRRILIQPGYKIKLLFLLYLMFPVVPLRIIGQVELDRPITFNDTRLVDGVTTEVSFIPQQKM